MTTTTTAAIAATVEITTAQSFLPQIEAQLLSSDTYHQLLTALQQKLGAVADEFHGLLTALSREAIQCAIQQLTSMGKSATEAAAKTLTVVDTDEVVPSVAETVAETVVETVAEKTSAGTIAESPKPSTREAALMQIGQTIRQTREAKGMSLQQLHTQTYVPLHHLKAWEMGQVDRLPEDIFIQGFLRQLSNALNLNSGELIAAIPVAVQPKPVVAEWQKKPLLSPMAQLSPVHLYVGYAALMAGAVGGLTWISQPQAQPDAKPKAQQAQPSVSMRQLHQTTRQAMQQVQPTLNVAPPEIFA
jgi:cytoskeleton protein RodZ